MLPNDHLKKLSIRILILGIQLNAYLKGWWNYFRLAEVRHIVKLPRTRWKEAINFATGKTGKDLGIDRILALAIVKRIEIIGEAA